MVSRLSSQATSPLDSAEPLTTAPDFALLVRRRRVELGLTQSEIAAAVGVDSQTVARWERGFAAQKRFWPRIASAIEVSELEVRQSIRGSQRLASVPEQHIDPSSEATINLLLCGFAARLHSGQPLTTEESRILTTLVEATLATS